MFYLCILTKLQFAGLFLPVNILSTCLPPPPYSVSQLTNFHVKSGKIFLETHHSTNEIHTVFYDFTFCLLHWIGEIILLLSISTKKKVNEQRNTSSTF